MIMSFHFKTVGVRLSIETSGYKGFESLFMVTENRSLTLKFDLA